MRYKAVQKLPRSRYLKKKKGAPTSKILVWIIVLNGLAMMWCSYILAWFDRIAIAETLSSTVVQVIVGTALGYLLTKTVENVSKYGSRLNRTTVEQEKIEVTELEE